MKTLIIILSIFLFPKECNNQTSNFNKLQERQDTITITYEAISRGFFEEISVSKKSVSISNDITKKTYETYNISKEDWNTFLGLLSKINLEELPQLKAPTSMREYDGAAHAVLIIKDGDKQIRSSTFDHGYAPTEIKELVEKLQTFKKLSSKQ